MKKGINQWAFADSQNASMEDCLKLAKEAGYETMEVCGYGEGPNSLDNLTQSRCEDIVAAAKRLNMEVSSFVSGLIWDYRLSSNDEGERNQAIKNAEKMLAIASYLKTDAILFIPGAVDVFFNPKADVIPYDLAYSRIQEGMRKLLPVAESRKVCMAVENVWNNIFMAPSELRDFIDSFNSPWVGSYLDLGNAVKYGYPEHWIQTLGKRVKRIHMKDYRRSVGTIDGFVPLLEGSIDFDACIKALKDVGYDYSLTVEQFPTKHHQVALHNSSRALDAILGRVPARV